MVERYSFPVVDMRGLWGRTEEEMGSKGSSSYGYAGLFNTCWGEEEYFRRMNGLHDKATPGQRQGIIDEIRVLEHGIIMLGLDNEYDQAMDDIELYEKLINET
jgi:hypothetical protein